MRFFTGIAITALLSTASTLSQAGTLSLTGQGSIRYTPDSVHLAFTAKGEGLTVAAARKALDRSVAKWDQQIQDLRDKLTDYSDAVLAVYTRREPDPRQSGSTRQTRIATQQIDFTLNHLQLLERVLSAADRAGFQYRLNSSDFFSSQQASLRHKALASAIDDARSQCRFVAKQLGQACGEVKSMQINQGRPRPEPFMASARANGPRPVTVGLQTLKATVNVTFELH